MNPELGHKLYIEIEPDDQNAYDEALQRGSIAELKSVLLSNANSEQRALIEELLPPDLVYSAEEDA